MADTAHFQIVYGGPSLENNEMDIRELAPALVAVADLLEESNWIINGGGSKINVNVRGSFKSGSFGIDFTVVQNAYQNIIELFSSPQMTATCNLLTLIGISGVDVIKDIPMLYGLIPFLKALKNRKIQRVENISEDRIRITITNQETIDADPRVLDLLKSQRIRDALEKIITEPLNKPGINEIKLGEDIVKNQILVSGEEKEYFKVPPTQDELLGESISEAYLQVVSLSFNKDNKWRFSRGENVFYASVIDEKFLGQIDRNEINFSKDDLLKVKLLTKDLLGLKGMRSEYTIIEVLEQRRAARQLPLPIESNKSP
jgi:hypothetical protein